MSIDIMPDINAASASNLEDEKSELRRHHLGDETVLVRYLYPTTFSGLSMHRVRWGQLVTTYGISYVALYIVRSIRRANTNASPLPLGAALLPLCCAL
ncbi:hypothetical protein VTK56DRAFT_152 [Thermocarpiscus australiensis]